VIPTVVSSIGRRSVGPPSVVTIPHLTTLLLMAAMTTAMAATVNVAAGEVALSYFDQQQNPPFSGPS
jgi:hypothetical protein